MKKVLILFTYINKNFSLQKDELDKFKKKYSKIILYNDSCKNKFFDYDYNKKNLNKIKNNYDKLGINLDLKKIYEINSFLKKIRFENKNKKFFVSPYFISGVILEEEFIFYELSKNYKIQFLRPELSFIKSRYILAKNLMKQPYIIKKKTIFSKKDYKVFKINYISSMYAFSIHNQKKKIKIYFYKILADLLNIFINFRFNKKPKKYALIILNNNSMLEELSNLISLKYFVNLFLDKLDYELVFLIHPNVNPFIFFLKMIKKSNIFFKNNKIIFLQKPKNLINIIENSKFIVHLSSSLSAQTLLFNKKILCLGKNIIYIKNLKNIVFNFNHNNFNFLKKKFNTNDILKTNKYLRDVLSLSVDNKGQFKLSTKKTEYTSNIRVNNKKKSKY